MIALMIRIAGVHEVIAAVALIITGIFIGRDGPSSIIWGALMILLGLLVLVFWLSGKGLP
jgi:Na+/H+ antiporter NhaD/arsenite permease-like protein